MVGLVFISQDELSAYYHHHLSEFDYAYACQLVVEEAGVAEELALRVREEEEDFLKLAREYSQDFTTRNGGRYLGVITHASTQLFPPEILNQILTAESGEVVGPFSHHGFFVLVYVAEHARFPLDEVQSEQLRARLFQEWLQEQLTQLKSG